MKNILSYDKETGIFTWNKNGKTAGSKNSRGYIKIKIKGKYFYAHRIAFTFMGIQMPKTVDHINKIPHDSRWENLRPATYEQNNANRRVYKTSKSGMKGVFFKKERGCWATEIQINKKTFRLGCFRTQKEAKFAYNKKAKEALGDFACY